MIIKILQLLWFYPSRILYEEEQISTWFLMMKSDSRIKKHISLKIFLHDFVVLFL